MCICAYEFINLSINKNKISKIETFKNMKNL